MDWFHRFRTAEKSALRTLTVQNAARCTNVNKAKAVLPRLVPGQWPHWAVRYEIGPLDADHYAATRKAASSPFYRMPSRSISQEQKIQPVTNGPNRPFDRLIDVALAATKSGRLCRLQQFQATDGRRADKAAIRGSVGTFQPNANWGTRSCTPRATQRRA